MPSAAYRLFAEAMAQRKQIHCTYQGYPRELCPVILGHSQGQEKALTFQFAGGSKSGLPPGGEWRCLWLASVRNVRLRDGRWYSGDRHTAPQGCVEIVDLDINPRSPYNPRRRLDDGAPIAMRRSAERRLSVALPPEQIALLKEVIAHGEYASADEAVREALSDWQLKRSLAPDDVQRLRRLWDEGKASGKPIKLDTESVIASARKRYRKSAAE
jgi:Arc/MetJ-type ribon-helix-helix transcriptional regulator